MRVLVWLLGALWLSGCSTTTLEPPKYYVLSGAPTAALPSAEATRLVTLDSIVLADYLESSNIVLQVSDHELFFSTNHLWAEPLKVGIEKALSKQVALTSVTESAAVHLDVVVDYFHIIDQDSVILAGSYTLQEAGKPLSMQRFSLSEPLQNSGYHYAVSVMSTLVGRLGQTISQQVSDYKSPK